MERASPKKLKDFSQLPTFNVVRSEYSFSSIVSIPSLFVHKKNTLDMYFTSLACLLLASSAYVSLVATTPLINLELRHSHEPIKPKVFLIDMVSFRNSHTSCAICRFYSHSVQSSCRRLKSGTESRSSICSPRTSLSLASPLSFLMSIALPTTMFVRS